MTQSLSFVLSFWVLFLSVLCSASADQKFINRTIDDQFGDEVTGRLVEYSPEQFWTQGNNCTGCAFHADNKSAFDGTWHDGSRIPANQPEPITFTFKFNGTAVYVYNILVRLALTDVNITLDGQFADHYSLSPNVSEQYLYDVPIFTRNDIPYGEHTVEVSAFGLNTTIVFFDYAIYTTNTTDNEGTTPGTTPGAPAQTNGADNNSAHTSHKTNVGAIAGGVVGGVVLVLALLAAFLWHRRSRTALPVLEPFKPEEARQRPNISEEFVEKKQDGFSRKGGYGTPPVLLVRPSAGPSDSRDPESSALSEDALRENVNVLRQHLAAVRASRNRLAIESQGPTSLSDIKSPTSIALENEIQSLRQEIEQLRTQQEQQSRYESTMISSPVTSELLREMAVLRAEMDELREQQDRGELPGYSPPAQPLPRPLPQLTGSLGPYGQ